MHSLPELGYSYDSLEPFIDAKTMEIHHSKHHAAYIEKLNAALKGSGLESKNIENLIRDINKIPENIRTVVRNNGGGHLNHSFFWPLLKKGTKPSGKLVDAIEERFGSFDAFKKVFSDAAAARFGSGWAWLVIGKGGLEVMSTANQDSPVSEGKAPIICIDVWEHAYYIKYQNRRADYIAAFFSVLNWQQAEKNYAKAKK